MKTKVIACILTITVASCHGPNEGAEQTSARDRVISDAAVQEFIQNDPEAFRHRLSRSAPNSLEFVTKLFAGLRETYGQITEYHYESREVGAKFGLRGPQKIRVFKYKIVTEKCPTNCFLQVQMVHERGEPRISGFAIARLAMVKRATGEPPN